MLVWGGGVIVPVLVLFPLLVYSFHVGAEVYPPLGRDADPNVLTIEVIGHQFWWEVRYPQHGVATANEIWMPAGEPVRFVVHAPDVIHSFWIPQLHGKMDMIPGRINELWVRADEPGTFRGQCAEYCGMGHALMAFWVQALPPAEFRAWVERRRIVAPDPPGATIAFGREVFFSAGCGHCHATRGAPLAPQLGTVGPDLTDLAARRTLAAGTLANTREALADWIADPLRIKPGSRMPPTALPPTEMNALLDYLETLR
jgi:cytochrome c oxidase subunit II